MASSGVTIVEITGLIAQLGGLAILAGTIAAGVAAVFRWYADEPLPRGLALLAGLSAVALYLNTTSALAEVITRRGGPTETQVALFNITAFAAGAAGAELGRRVGDRFETDVFLRPGGADTDDDVGRFGRALGRVVEVQLPPEIEDVVGYDPVEERTKENLAGQTFVFPRGLDAEELESRLVTRLKSDYGVGTVDVDLAADGTVEHLGVGRRAAGIGPTLPPATNAVAVEADPPFAASAGDLVQLWETAPARRVLTGELRGVAGDTVTLAIDAADTPKVDPGATYRLVTLPVEDRPDREFASLLRAADETYTSVTVAERSPIAGAPVGALSVSIAAMADAEGETTALPTQDAVIEPGTVLFAIGTPDRLRRLEVAATALAEGIQSTRRASPASASAEASDSAAAEDGCAADSEVPADRESAGETVTSAESGETPGADSETPAAGTGPGQSEAAGAEVNLQGDEAAAEGGPGDGETAAASDETPITDETTSGTTPDEADGGSTPPSFDELADAVGEERAADPTPDDDADSAGSGHGPGGPATGSGGVADPDDADTDDDLSELSFADDASGDDLDDLGDLSVGEDVDAGDDDLGGFEDIAFGEDGADDAEQDDSVEMEGDEDGTADDGDDGRDDDETDNGENDDGDDDERDGGDNDQSEDDERDDGDDDQSDGGDDDQSDGGDDDQSDESNDSGGGGGGGGTFAQLKEEFESGDADWADEIDDSPGGDMRLDE